MPDQTDDFILRMEGENRYYVMDNFSGADVCEKIANMYMEDRDSPELCLHEIIMCHKKQKLYFDVDIAIKDYPNATPSAIIECYLNTLNHVFQDPSFAVFNSSDANKISIHIIITNMYADNTKELRDFMKFFVERIKPIGMDLLYKKNQGFRMPLCHKSGSVRYKLPEGVNDITHDIAKRSVAAGMITYFPVAAYHFKTRLDQTLKTEFNKSQAAKPIQQNFKKFSQYAYPPDKVLELVKNWENTEEPSYSIDQTDRGYRLVRIAPSYCPICLREHSSENKSAYVTKKELHVTCFRQLDKKGVIPLPSAYVPPTTEVQEPSVEMIPVEFDDVPEPDLDYVTADMFA